MSKKVTASHPKLFIGLDIHKRSWKVHFCTDITEGSTKSMGTMPDELSKYVIKYYSDHEVSICYEAGCCGYTAARAFESFGWTTLVVNPSDVPRPAKNAVVKTDKIDAKNLSKQLRSGHLRPIPIPVVDRECFRSLTRQRSQLVKDQRRIKSRIKMSLLYYGIEIPEEYDNANWSKAFIDWIWSINWNYTPGYDTMCSMLEQYEFTSIQIKEVSNQIRKYCRSHFKKDYNLLRSVPGIGPLTAAYILAEIGDLRQFSSLKKLASYVGLVPGIYSSGDKEINKGVTSRANRITRSMLIESSWVAIRIDPIMQSYYRSHSGKDSKAVIFKVARKLLSRTHAVIKSGMPYRVGME